MKVLLYFENQNKMKQSGIGRALVHQKIALDSAKIEYTLDSNDNYDFAHINTLFFASYKVLKKCKKKNLKVIVHGHSTKEDFRNSFRCWKLIAPLYNKLILRMYRQADAIITPTNYSKSLIENYKGVNCPVYAVSNGIMLDEYKYDENKIKAFYDHFKLSKEDKIVISTGMYFDRKGIIDFFEVARANPDITFIWFGNLAKWMCQLKVLKAIKKRPKNAIMAGYISGDVIKGAYMAADCFLFLSKEETEGIVVLEALACKSPVLIRDIDVYKDWMTDGVNCYKAKNLNEVNQKLLYILNNDTTKIKENGYKLVEERTIEKVGSELKNIYLNIYDDKK